MLIETEIAQLLQDRGWRVTVGEIDSGGLISARLMAVPGATKFFRGGIVCYGGAYLRDVVKVPEETLREHSAVSKETTLALARGVLNLTGADVALGESGMTGPTGGASGHPVGLVYIALVSKEGQEIAIEENWDSPDRLGNMTRTADRAMRLLKDFLEGKV